VALAVTSAVTEFNEGNLTKFSTKGHPKSNGLNITVSYPNSWTAKEGEHPHIVQKFISPSSQGYEAVNIFIKALPATISTCEMAGLFTPTEMKDMIPDGAIFIDAKSTKIEGLPVGIMEFSLRQERAGITLDTQNITYMFAYGSNLFQLQCSVAGQSTTPDALAQHMEEFRPLFFLMANSIVLQDKWN
jgi:hypothetical protein